MRTATTAIADVIRYFMGKPPGFVPRRFVRQLDVRFNGTRPPKYARCRALWLPIEIKEEIVSMEPVLGKHSITFE